MYFTVKALYFLLTFINNIYNTKEIINPLNQEIECKGLMKEIHFPPIAMKAPITNVTIAGMLKPEPPKE